MIRTLAPFFFGRIGIVTIILLIVVLVIFALNDTAAAATTLGFDDLLADTHVTTQYSNRGVLFPNGAYLDTDPAARSGNRVLRSGYPPGEFDPGPFVIEFTSEQSLVRLFVGTTLSKIARNGTLRAYDINGVLIAQDGPKSVAAKTFTTSFEVTTTSPSIRRIEIEIPPSEFEAIDDLEFQGKVPAPLPTVPPQVQITSPQNNAQLDVPTTTKVQGTVTGEGLWPTVTLKLEYPQPPKYAGFPFTSIVPLSVSGTTRTFSVDLGLGLGPQKLTVEAKNISGLKGNDTVFFMNLPKPISTRYTTAGGQGTFGDFRFGSVIGNCTIAFYKKGAIAVVGTTTRVVLGDIHKKWFPLRYELDCPTAEERSAPGGAKAQDFKKGRIYAGLPTGAHYVPLVFVQAIDKLGGETATGVPIHDPSSAYWPWQTWLFQQFTRPSKSGLPSTLEIKGTPPILWVERQSGDLSVNRLTDISPTIWQQFPCSGNQGPCSVSAPSSAPPIKDAGNNYCGGETYPWGPPAWVPIRGNHYLLNSVYGFIEKSYLSGTDNPLTHECTSIFGFGEGVDWNIDLIPLHPFRYLLTENKDTLGIEYEECWAKWFHTGWGWPGLPGVGKPVFVDLLFVSGRWIIDCGHSSFHSEIHPPAVLAFMRTEEFQGRPATVANIWINGTYTGDPVEIEIYPPPRPSPRATLVYSKPKDSEAALNVKVEDKAEGGIASPYPSPTYVRVRFTASPRKVPVTDAGEMKHQPGRGYTGRWYVYWTK
jgi:hypothetical protein